MRLELRDQLERGTPDRVMETGHLLEQRVRVEEPIVDRRTGFVDDDLAEAVALVDGLEQFPEASVVEVAHRCCGRDAPVGGVCERCCLIGLEGPAFPRLIH